MEIDKWFKSELEKYETDSEFLQESKEIEREEYEIKKMKNIKPIPDKLFTYLLDYILFLYDSQSYVDSDSYEKHRCELHQRLFQCLNADRIQDRDKAIGKFIDDLICYSLVCPICLVSCDNQNNCFDCGRNLSKKDIQFNIDVLKQQHVSYIDQK